MKLSAAESRRAIRAIHLALESLPRSAVGERNKFVFIGGGLVPLLITDPAASPARPTKDVDVVFRVETVSAYSYMRQDLLRVGFRDDIFADKPLCALFFDEWRVDFLCSNTGVIAGANRWFNSVMEDPVEDEIDGVNVWRASTPSWIATKLEAWLNRGRLESGAPDYYHQDMEDILAVVDGRPECVAEVADGIAAVSGFIRQHFRIMLSTPDFLSALPGHTGGHERSEIVLKRLKSIL
jgi:hypothetical protein